MNSTKKIRHYYACTVPGLPGKYKVRAEDEKQALRFLLLMFPNAREPRIARITEAEAFGDEPSQA